MFLNDHSLVFDNLRDDGSFPTSVKKTQLVLWLDGAEAYCKFQNNAKIKRAADKLRMDLDFFTSH